MERPRPVGARKLNVRSTGPRLPSSNARSAAAPMPSTDASNGPSADDEARRRNVEVEVEPVEPGRPDLDGQRDRQREAGAALEGNAALLVVGDAEVEVEGRLGREERGQERVRAG